MSHITIGTDPEVFVINPGTNEIVSAVGLIPGTKEKPYKTKHGWIHIDNVVAEFNVPPATNEKEFVANVHNTLSDLRNILQEQGYDIAIRPSAELHPKYLDSYEAQQFGCLGDYDAWFIDTCTPMNAEVAGQLRSAGGHIHIGYDSLGDSESKVHVIRNADLFIGLPSVLLDNDKQRRKLYGQGGRFRPTSYGVEYRVPSNFWLKSTALTRWIYRQARACVDMMGYASGQLDTYEKIRELKDVINSGDKIRAQQLMKQYSIGMPIG